MFFLHNANRTETLAEHLADVIDNTGGHDLFEKAIFLVQSREMERMLSQFLADRFGVWGNSKYLLPLQFIDYVCALLALDLDGAAFERSVLTWRLERLLRDLHAPAMAPLGSYLAGEQVEVKRYQLARRIADLFDQYQIMRPQLIHCWEHGRNFNGNAAEEWQKHLWSKLREEGRGPHRGEIVASLIDCLNSRSSQSCQDLRRIFVFGLHTLPPLFLEVLRALSAGSDVHFFLLTPCRQYWGDIETRRARLRRLQEDDQASPGLETYHPLLSSFGRQGADFQHLLLTGVEEMADGPDLFVVNDEQAEPAVLQRLQNDLLDGRFKTGLSTNAAVADDDSILVVSCHSRMRETAVLKDYILRWLSEKPELGLHDIVVMAPDIQLYADFISALFGDVAHDISDCRKRRDNRYFEIFSQFLNLFLGRYSSPEIISLLEQPEVSRSFLISGTDLEVIRVWLKDSGIRWGLSADQRRRDGLCEFAAGSWRHGLERMLLGLAAGSKEPIDTLVPYIEVEGSEAELLGNLCLFIDLIDQSRGLLNRPKTLAEWSELLYDLSLRLFADDDSADLLNLQETLASLGEKYSGYHAEEVSFEVVRQWFAYEAETTSTIGFLRGRLTFCSMLPMRSIPFKIICLLGLNDGEFPKQDRFLPFDLLSQSYEKGDRSQRADDRYQFLEAILAAREKLYISYIGQSIRTNEEIPPSPVVSELLEAVEETYGEIMVVKQPLQPFDEAYFAGGSELFSHDQYYCRTARALRSAPDAVTEPWFMEAIEAEVETNLTLAELSSFITNPQRYFVRNILNMKLQTAAELLDDHEPFTVDGLTRYQVNQQVVQELLDGRSMPGLLAELQQQQLWPLGYPGQIRFETLYAEIDVFVERVRTVEPGKRLQSCQFDIGAGPYRLSGSLDHLYEGGQLIYRYAPLTGRDLLLGWLLHLLGKAVLAEPAATRIIATDAYVAMGAQIGDEDDLHRLLDLYRNGCSSPSKLYVDPAFAYCLQVVSNRGKGKKEPLQKAVEDLQKKISKGYAPELDILFPEPDARTLLDDEFEQLSRDLLLNLWDRIEISEG